jgi:transposase
MDRRQREALARRRAELIMEVRSGRLTATDAAKALGVSRKTYYQWEKRALEGMIEALENRGAGRPMSPSDPEKERLSTELSDLRREKLLLERRLHIREELLDLNPAPHGTAEKK